MDNDKTIAFLKKYLDGDALLWVLGYLDYCHAIDDFIDRYEDGQEHREVELLVKVLELPPLIYANGFFLKNFHRLYALIKGAGNAYCDSELMKKSNSKWKQHYAEVLRLAAHEVIVAAIEIYGGYEQRRQASIELRELAYFAHVETTKLN
jgi:hypothetical protein